MLYVFYGTDKFQAQKKARVLIDALLEKKPDAGFFTLDDETFSEGQLDEYMSGQGLFTEKYIVYLKNIFFSEEAEKVFFSRLKEIAASENIFILLAGKVLKKNVTKLEKHATKIQECVAKEKTATRKSEFNIFSLTDALSVRDKKRLWVLYTEGLRAGVSPEEMHGILWWQVKVLLQVAQGQEEGLKPFVIQKAKRAMTKYTSEELQKIAFDLVTLFHESRRGTVEIGIALEQFILNM